MRLVIGCVLAAGLGITGLAGVVGYQICTRPDPARFDPPVLRISTGERVYLGTYVQGSKMTVVLFLSSTALGGRAITKRLEAISAVRDDVRVRVIDIGSPPGEVARQYGIEKVPQAWLYRDGKRLTDEFNTVWQILEAPR